MKLKRVLALILVVAMTASMLMACGKNNEADTEEIELMEEVVFPLNEKMSFTGFSVMTGQYSLEDNLAWQKSLERANIEIELTSVLTSELKEKRNLLLTGGQYPEVFIKSGISADEYGMSGILLPLEDLIREYAPNLTKLLDETDGWQYITAADGHVYSLPMGNEETPRTTPYWINKTWLDNLGLAEPTSYEELYNVLKAFKEKDANGNGDPNDEIPYLASTTRSPMILMAYQDYAYDSSTFMSEIDGELTYVCTDDSYKEFLAWLTKLFKEGLMDKNSFTNNIDQQRATGQSGDVVGSFADTGGFQTIGRDNDTDYVILTPFQEGTYPVSDPYAANALAITDVCKHPEVIVAWADYFYTEEGATLAWMGIEGETYEVNEDGTWSWILGNGYGDDVSTVRSSNTIQGTQAHPSIQPELWKQMSGDADPNEVYLNEQRQKVYGLGRVPLPAMSLTEDEKDELSTIKADTDAYVSQYLAQVVSGQIKLEETWDDYVDTLETMGLDRMVEIYRDVYARASK